MVGILFMSVRHVFLTIVPSAPLSCAGGVESPLFIAGIRWGTHPAGILPNYCGFRAVAIVVWGFSPHVALVFDGSRDETRWDAMRYRAVRTALSLA